MIISKENLNFPNWNHEATIDRLIITNWICENSKRKCKNYNYLIIKQSWPRIIALKLDQNPIKSNHLVQNYVPSTVTIERKKKKKKSNHIIHSFESSSTNLAALVLESLFPSSSVMNIAVWKKISPLSSFSL